MTMIRSVFKGGLKLGIGQAVTQACAFVRNVMVARFVSPDNFGVAAAFAITVSIFEMISNLAVESLLVQAEDGEKPGFQETVQLFQVIRGVGIGVIIFIVAGPTATLFGVPEARWCFQLLAIVPVVRGFTHLDMNRVQRQLRYNQAVVAEVGSSLLVTGLAWPLAAGLKNYTAMLWMLLAQSVFFVIASHLVAERRYSWTWHKSYAKRMIDFGWPLIINGLLLFGIFQGDRFIIGTADQLFGRGHYTMFDLGIYSVAFALTIAPTMMIARMGLALFLPLLSRVQASPSEFNRRYLLISLVLSVVAGLVGIVFVVDGGMLIRLIYGDAYAPAAAFIGWLAVMQAVRIIRIGPTVAAMAKGDTRNAMIANVFRTLALLAVLVIAISGGSLAYIAAAGFGGELIALMVSVIELRRTHAIPASVCVRSVVPTGATLLLAALTLPFEVRMPVWVFGISVHSLLALTLFAGVLVAFPTLRSDGSRIISKLIYSGAAKGH